MVTENRSILFWVYAMLLTLAVGGAATAALSGDIIVPVAAVFLIAMVKARLVVLDFIGLRDSRSNLRFALLLWPAVFLAAALGRHMLLLALAI